MTTGTKWLITCHHLGGCVNSVVNKETGRLECGFGDTRCVHCGRSVLVVDITEIHEKNLLL